MLNFNGRAFSTLSAVLDHICDFPEGEARVPLYLEIVQQASNLFYLSSAFSQGLVTAIKKDKSWAIAKWTKNDVSKLLAPLSRHLSADRLGRNRREGALSTINRQWGPDITDFFRSLNESEKCLRQIAHIACCPQIHSYRDARRAVNAYVVERLIFRPTRHSGRFKTTTADWVALDGVDPPDHDVPYARLVAAGIHVGEFGQLVEGPPPLCLAPADPPHDLSAKPGPGSVEPTQRKGVVIGEDEERDQTSDKGVGSGDDEGDQSSDKGVAGKEDGDSSESNVSSASQSHTPPPVDPARKSQSSQTASPSSVDPPHKSRTHTLPPGDPSPDAPSDVSPGLSDTAARLEARELFAEWSKCRICSDRVVSSVLWRENVCYRGDCDFLEGMYLLAGSKYCLLMICDNHIKLLSSKLYLVNAPTSDLRSRMDMVWENRHSTATLTSFIEDHKTWFYDEFPFV